MAIAKESQSGSATPILLPGQPVQIDKESNRNQTKNNSSGTYKRGNYTLSSIVGKQNGSKVISKRNNQTKNCIPHPGDIIIGRITRVNQKQANVSILIINDQPCTSGNWKSCGFNNSAAGEDPSGLDFYGIIRIQDVRSTEKDKVNMFNSFKPNDIIKAQVISLGDQRAYYLATFSNELGVIYALPELKSNSLNPILRNKTLPLIPINWQEMKNNQNNSIEKRKVAKPQNV